MGAPVLFVTQKDGSIRMCIYYKQHSKVTINKKYHLPRIINLFDLLHGARNFSKIDLRFGWYKRRVRCQDIPQTYLWTMYDNYKFLAMPYGLTNAPTDFMDLMKRVPQNNLNSFEILFIDYIWCILRWRIITLLIWGHYCKYSRKPTHC